MRKKERGTREGDWTKGDIIFILSLCGVLYAIGIEGLIHGAVVGMAFLIVPSLFVPTFVKEALQKIAQYREARRKRSEKKQLIIVGGVASHERRKRKKSFRILYPYPSGEGDEITKGKVMRELGLSYEKIRVKKEKEAKVTEVVHTRRENNRKINNRLIEELRKRGKIRITNQTHFGRLRGHDIAKMMKRAAKRAGVQIEEKGGSIVIIER